MAPSYSTVLGIQTAVAKMFLYLAQFEELLPKRFDGEGDRGTINGRKIGVS